MSASSQLLLIGTYTPKDGASRGIYAVRLDSATGALGKPELVAETPNPTFLAQHPGGRFVYALGEAPTSEGKPGGAAVAFTLDSSTGKLTPLNRQPTDGAGCAHLGLDATARLLVLVSYHGGQLFTFPVGTDGRVGPRTGTLTQTGQLGPNQARQDKPHPHSVFYSNDNRFAYVCDLGLDRIFTYRVDAAAATLTPVAQTATAPGAGPRHAKFSADGRFFYAINELDSSIAVYGCDAATGALTPRQAVSTLPDGFKGTSICAEIRIHPNGRFVYGSNRGHDSLAVFARDETDGTLTRIQIEPCGGGHPRNFALSPDGKWLVCANRDANNLVVFAVDAATGRLTPAGHTATVPQAVCVLFCQESGKQPPR
jgi:6-phosphogluconolactonase